MPLGVHGNHAGTQQASGQRGITHAFGGADNRGVALGTGVDVAVSGAVVVADGGDERSVRNAHDVERNGFFDTPRHELPYRYLGRDIFGHKDAVTAGNPGFLIVEGVDF